VPFAHAVSTLLLALADDTVAVRVSYDAPASCPTEAAFYEAVRARTDHVREASSDESALDVNVRVSRTERGFVGEVREAMNHNESSARSVDGTTCKEVVEALSLTVALSVDPNAHAPTPTPVPSPQTAAVAVCPPVPEALPVAATPAEPPLELEIGLSALATEVLTSDFSAGGALSGTFLRKLAENRSASLELSLLFAATAASSPAAGHRAQLEGLSLAACPVRWQFGSIELSPCALGIAGVLEATGRGVAEPETITRSWWSAGVDVQLSALLGDGFVLESGVGASVPLVKRKFYLDVPSQIVTQTPVIAPMAHVGLGFRF
jgi:hypothetical protein